MRATLLLLAAAVACAGPPDGRGASIARRIEDSLGGRPAFEALRGVTVEAGERTPLGERRWRVRLDLRTGAAALEGLDGEGRAVRAAWDAEGAATIERDTETLAGPAAADLAAEARRRADLALWGALAPWRLRAPGVRLAAEGRRADPAGGAVHDVLRADVPADVAGAAAGTYRIRVAADGRPVRWSYVRADGTRGEEAWGEWSEAGGVGYAAVRLDEPRRVMSFISSFEAET